MKILIFGDVHGNLPALEMLFSIEENSFDSFICHGDVVNYGPWSNECISLLSEKKEGTLLLGNHEKYFLEGAYDGKNQIAKAFFDHCYNKFNKSLLNVINTFEESINIENFVVQHTIFNQYVFKDTDLSNLEVKHDYIIGHSHQQFKRLENKFKIYNTGSLGQNRQFINQSCYIKLDTKSKEVELKSFNLGINKMINKMKSERYSSICIDYYLSKKQF
ncbi:metallophosphoesterase [Lacihabitans sp. CCS-44]|uniref:metallophosphoesterase family protein n=1 Tax=Lacihabitans sp. CCS-44 TaxID=2487331 RepID=UPI0020CC7FA0|nr:metallophosphoesterase [Lacihabitans sp. CCS-44]MCP9754966.1 metallophosphoesterase [Lacihabitans sp. CCS-44]